mmetsp:Transcript_791/g.2161  ORF Transcript_791/g.2161 Transcript_791/m.2161 type:complete len:170 (+) Transcript_791:97-606(+)
MLLARLSLLLLAGLCVGTSAEADLGEGGVSKEDVQEMLRAIKAAEDAGVFAGEAPAGAASLSPYEQAAALLEGNGHPHGHKHEAEDPVTPEMEKKFLDAVAKLAEANMTKAQKNADPNATSSSAGTSLLQLEDLALLEAGEPSERPVPDEVVDAVARFVEERGRQRKGQ